MTTMRKSIDDVPGSVRQYMNNDWKPKADKIREDFEGSDIQDKFDEVSQAIQEYGPSTSDRNTDLDYLYGHEATGYIIDMIFAQTYASESRKKMAREVSEAVNEVLGENTSMAYFEDSIESVHNYIDFEDATIRKGACRAHEDERLVVPFNMAYGTILARGKGKDDWNNSSAHGAGRAMSRTAAHDTFDQEDFDEQIGDVFMSKQPMDEIPGAYKPAEKIEEALGDSVEVIDRVEPFMSIKAE
jgi:RNA-splicing ligase RtcB